MPLKRRMILSLIFAVLFVLILGLTAFAANETTDRGNNEPAIPEGCLYVKLDNVDGTGTWNLLNGQLTVTITDIEGVETVSWEVAEDAPITIAMVYVKGGNEGGELEDYRPDGSKGDTGLTTPTGQDVSHVSFYYCEDPDPEKVTLIVEKEIIDESGNALSEDSLHKDVEFTVEVNGTTYKVTAAAPLVLTDLDPGSFAVVESTELPANYSYVSGNETVTITTEDGVKTVTIINRYTPPDVTGTLIIQKRIVDVAGNSVGNNSPHNSVAFTVKVNGTSYTFSVNEPLTLTGLPLGEYDIKEISLPKDYHYVSGNQKVVVSEGTTTVLITNKFEPEDRELPRTSSSDLYMLLAGIATTTGGFLLRKRLF